MTLAIVVAWIACGVFAATLANSKGRSWSAWLVLGLIFGILALIAVGFMPPIEPKKNIPSSGCPATSLERKCPFCAEMIKAEAIVCKHCGRDVEPVAMEPKNQDNDEATANKCKHCGAKLDINFSGSRCPQCGWALN